MLKQLLNNYCNDKTNVICPTATVSSQLWFLVRLTTLMNFKICPVPSKRSILFCFACWSEWHTIPSQAVALSCQAADICRKTTGFRFSRDYDERAYFLKAHGSCNQNAEGTCRRNTDHCSVLNSIPDLNHFTADRQSTSSSSIPSSRKAGNKGKLSLFLMPMPYRFPYSFPISITKPDRYLSAFDSCWCRVMENYIWRQVRDHWYGSLILRRLSNEKHR